VFLNTFYLKKKNMNKTKIYFIEKKIDFNSSDLDSFKISGSEKTLINISNELAKNTNFDIKVFNNTKNEIKSNNVQWININNISFDDIPDHLISMSDANLLSLIECNKKYLWSHSVQPVEKFFRKKQFLPFIMNKPIMLLEGEYHFETRSFFTSMFGKKIIKLAPDYDFINKNINIDTIPLKKAIFTTRSDRNLLFLLKCWKSINELSQNSELHINPPYNLSIDDKNMGIKLRVKVNKSKLIDELINSRVMLNPGHKGEVYCLAAAEAREMCLPLVTMGYGSLYERVEHNLTGFIAKNEKEFIDYSIKILNDDNTYFRLKENLIKIKGNRTYKNVSEDLLKILNN